VNERKPPRRGAPQVEVIRRPAASPVKPAEAPAPRPEPAPAGAGAPQPAFPGAPAVERRVVPGTPPAPRPMGPRPPPRDGRPPMRRSGPPRPPPTEEQIQALAKREHVPARIAKGELEGKMRVRVWRKLHAEEAKRFDEAYALVDKHPGLDLADAFGMVQSGMSLEELRARREKTQKKQAVKEARGSVQGGPLDGYIQALIDSKSEVAVVLGERTVLDVLTAVEPIAFHLERSGRLEKLQVVLLARRSSWDKLAARLDRDPRLAQKPSPIVRQPERRPVSDPRPFVSRVGKTLTLQLRNGIKLSEALRATGPFDLLLGPDGDEVFVPLHAILKWEDPAEVA